MVLGTGDQARPRDLLVDRRDQGGPSPEEPHGKEVKGWGVVLGVSEQACTRDLLVDRRDQSEPPPEEHHSKKVKGYGWR